MSRRHGAVNSNESQAIIGHVGTATLSGGTVDVVDSSITAASIIFLTPQGTGLLAGMLRVTSRTAGVGFTIGTANVLDTAVVGYLIIEP